MDRNKRKKEPMQNRRKQQKGRHKSGKSYQIKVKRMTVIICLEVLCIAGLLGGVWRRTDSRHAQAQTSNAVVPEEELLPAPEQLPDTVSRDEVEAGAGEKVDILLVNKDHKLPEDYEVKLLTLPDKTNKAAEEAYQPLMDMLNAGRREGLSFEICSSYRDVKRQQELFDEDLEALMRRGFSYKEAYEEVARGTMPPGYSEHSTGLAFDIVALDYQMLDEGQEKTEENKWLRKHCAEYGFILRYPDGAEDITGISYESWHFRYVGVEAAEYIMEHGLTLEEYLES